MTTYKIKDIKPNPFRNMDRYPIDREKVEALKKSFETTDFWDNIVARKTRDGCAEIAYGHHRLVALQEAYGKNHEVSLITRPLDDSAMLRMMANENMEDWGTSAIVDIETVRATVQAYADGKIELDVPEQKRRFAPSFVSGGNPLARADSTKPYSGETVAAFLGWTKPDGEPQAKLRYALLALEYIELGVLKETSFRGLGSKQAEAVVREARAAYERRRAVADERDRVAEAARKQAEKAAAEAEQSERKAAEAKQRAKDAETDRARERAKEQQRAAEDLATKKHAEQKQAEQRQRVFEDKARQKRAEGRQAAANVGATVSRAIKSGKGSILQAPQIARKEDPRPKRKGPPPHLNKVFEFTAGKLAAIIDPNRSQRLHGMLDSLVEFSGDQQVYAGSRNEVVKTLRRVARWANGYADRIENYTSNGTVRARLGA